MKSFISRTVAAAVAAFALSGAAQAADSVNVAFFLEWATPNQIAKVDKAYDEAMGVDVRRDKPKSGAVSVAKSLGLDSYMRFMEGDAFELELDANSVDILWCDFGVGES